MSYRQVQWLMFLLMVMVWHESCACGGGSGQSTISGTTTATASPADTVIQKVFDFSDASEYTTDPDIAIANSLAILNPINSEASFTIGANKNTVAQSNTNYLTMLDQSYTYRLPDANSATGWFNMANTVFLYHLTENPANHNASLIDSSSNAYSAQLKTSSSATNNAVTLRFTSVISLDGVNDYIDLNSARAAMATVSTNHSLALWFKDETAGEAAAAILSLSDGTDAAAPFVKAYIVTGDSSPGSTNESLCYVFEDDTPGIDIQACVETVGGHRGVRDGHWHHLALINDAGTIRMYLDGKLQTLSGPDRGGAVGTGFFLDVASPTVMNLGARVENGTRSEYYKGQMAEVVLLGQVLSTFDVREIYERQAPLFRGAYHTPAQSATGANRGWLDMDLNSVHFTFEEDSISNSDAVNDLSGNGNSGVATVSPVAERSVAGVIGKAMDFDDNDCVVFAENAGTTDLGSADEFSISLWAAADPGVGANGVLFSKGNGTNPHPFSIFYTHSGDGNPNTFSFSARGTGNVATNGNATYTDYNWHHIVVVRDSTNTTLFINGVQQNQVANVTGTSDNDEPLTVGCAGDGVGGYRAYFTGRIDELNLWKRALSTAEVEKIFYLQSPNHPAQYSSSILDAESSINWQTVIWSAPSPYSKPLIPDAEVEVGYDTGGVVMTANELLLHLDDASTAIADNSPNAIVGVTYDGTTNQIEGPSGMAIGLRSNSLSLADNDLLDFDNVDFSIAMWFRQLPKVQTGDLYLIHKSDTVTTPYFIYVEGDATDRGRIFAGRSDNSSPVSFASQTRVDDGKWHHVAFVKNGSTLQLYVDGLLENTTTDTATGTCANAAALVMGLDPGAAVNADVDLDEIAIWSRALNSSEVNSIFNRLSKQLKIQFRSCDDSVCAGETYEGPTGDASSFFVEDQDANTRRQLASISGLTPNQFLQFRIYFESTRLWDLPVLRSLQTTPILYPATMAQILINESLSYLSITGFAIERQESAKGSVFFQLSYDDGNTWVYFDGTTWSPATGLTDFSSAGTIDANLATFNELGSETKSLKIRVLMSAAGVSSGNVTLDNIIVDYDPVPSP